MRRATPEEEAAIRGFFEDVQAGIAQHVLRGELGIVDRDGSLYAVLCARSMFALPQFLLEGAAGGLPLGTLEGGAFHLDLQGAILMTPHTKSQTVRANDHASRLFLYGRNILGESVEWHDPSLERGDACIVTNPRGEAMGIGRVVGSFKGPGEAVRPVHDLGSYLRDQDEDA